MLIVDFISRTYREKKGLFEHLKSPPPTPVTRMHIPNRKESARKKKMHYWCKYFETMEICKDRRRKSQMRKFLQRLPSQIANSKICDLNNLNLQTFQKCDNCGFAIWRHILFVICRLKTSARLQIGTNSNLFIKSLKDDFLDCFETELCSVFYKFADSRFVY